MFAAAAGRVSGDGEAGCAERHPSPAASPRIAATESTEVFIEEGVRDYKVRITGGLRGGGGGEAVKDSSG